MVAVGAYYVDGALATDYNDHVTVWTFGMLRRYIVMRYAAGIPVIPEGHGRVADSPFWAFDGLDAADVPAWVQWAVSPIALVLCLATELLNTAAAYPLLACKSAAAIAAIVFGRRTLRRKLALK